MTDAAQIAAEPLRFEHTYSTDDRYPVRFTRAYFAYIYSRPRRLVPFVVILILFAVIAATSPAPSTSWIFPTFFVLLLGVTYAVTYSMTLSKIRARIPTGSTFGVGFRSATFVMQSPQVTSEVAYSLYATCERRGTFVVLRQRVIRVSTFLPAEIFTDESFEYLRTQIGLSAPTL